MPAGLTVSDLNLSYGSKQVLFDVALEAKPGHILALIGPLGSGKSTLLRVINRLVDNENAVYSGNVSLNGSSIFMKDASELRTQVGLVLAEPVLFPGSVFDNIVGGLRLHGIRDKALLQEKADKVLKSMDARGEYRDLFDVPAEDLPLAQQQMVAIFRALAMEPELLLLDEPGRVLDAASVVRLEEALTGYKKECTIIMATNILQQAGRIADETALMIGGRVIEWGETGELFSHPRDARTERYLTGRFE